MNIHRHFHYFLWVFPLLLITACGDSSEEVVPTNIQADIVGRWSSTDISFFIDGVAYEDYIRQLSAQAGIPLSDRDIQDLVGTLGSDIDGLLGESIEFRSDGTVVSTYSDYGTGEGSWSVSGQTLSLNNSNGDLVYAIETLTQQELIISFSGDGSDPTLDIIEDGTLRVVMAFDRL